MYDIRSLIEVWSIPFEEAEYQKILIPIYFEEKSIAKCDRTTDLLKWAIMKLAINNMTMCPLFKKRCLWRLVPKIRPKALPHVWPCRTWLSARAIQSKIDQTDFINEWDTNQSSLYCLLSALHACAPFLYFSRKWQDRPWRRVWR